MAEFLNNKIVGTWTLVSWVYRTASGNEVDYFGKHPTGVLMYDAFGNMSVQVMRADRIPFASRDINGGTPLETKAALDSYIAYYGKYEEAKPGEFAHTVQGSLFPNWLGHREIRYAALEGDELTLSTPPVPTNGEEIVFHITWRRVK
jgi:hypothetical protein